MMRVYIDNLITIYSITGLTRFQNNQFILYRYFIIYKNIYDENIRCKKIKIITCYEYTYILYRLYTNYVLNMNRYCNLKIITFWR